MMVIPSFTGCKSKRSQYVISTTEIFFKRCHTIHLYVQLIMHYVDSHMYTQVHLFGPLQLHTSLVTWVHSSTYSHQTIYKCPYTYIHSCMHKHLAILIAWYMCQLSTHNKDAGTFPSLYIVHIISC